MRLFPCTAPPPTMGSFSSETGIFQSQTYAVASFWKSCYLGVGLCFFNSSPVLHLHAFVLLLSVVGLLKLIPLLTREFSFLLLSFLFCQCLFLGEGGDGAWLTEQDYLKQKEPLFFIISGPVLHLAGQDGLLHSHFYLLSMCNGGAFCALVSLSCSCLATAWASTPRIPSSWLHTIICSCISVKRVNSESFGHVLEGNRIWAFSKTHHPTGLCPAGPVFQVRNSVHENDPVSPSCGNLPSSHSCQSALLGGSYRPYSSGGTMLTLCLEQRRPVWGFVNAGPPSPHNMRWRLPPHCSRLHWKKMPLLCMGDEKRTKGELMEFNTFPFDAPHSTLGPERFSSLGHLRNREKAGLLRPQGLDWTLVPASLPAGDLGQVAQSL